MLNGAVARRYARAVFEIAVEQKSVDGWLNDLQTMRAVFLQPEVEAFLSDVKPRFENKKEVVSKILPGLSPSSLNLAYLLVAKGRTEIIDELVAEYEALVNQYRGVEVVEVKTAVPLDESERSQLIARLGAITGKKVILQTAIDPEIIGGLVAKIGDKVIDGSTKARLLSLKLKLAGAR